MPKLPVLKAEDVITVLEKLVFQVDHVTGSHKNLDIILKLS